MRAPAVTRVAGEHKALLVEAPIAGIGDVETVEHGLGSEYLVGEEFLKAGVGAAVGIEGESRVSRIHVTLDRRHAPRWTGALSRRSHLKAVCLHLDAAEVEFINERVALEKKDCGALKCSVKRMPPAAAMRHRWSHPGCWRTAGDVQAEVTVRLKVRDLKEQVNLLLQQAICDLQ